MTPEKLAASDQGQAKAREQAKELIRAWAQHDYECHPGADCKLGHVPAEVSKPVWQNEKEDQFFLVVELLRRLRRQGNEINMVMNQADQ